MALTYMAVTAMIRVYGLLTFVVRQRTREVGIRLALGARSEDVAWLVVRKSARLLALGLGLGLVAAYVTTGLLTGFLYGIDGRDPLTFMAAPILLALAAVVATFVPARQVSRVDPNRSVAHGIELAGQSITGV